MPNAVGPDAWSAWQRARYIRQRSIKLLAFLLFPTRVRAATKKQPFGMLRGWLQSFYLYLCQEVPLLLLLLWPLVLALLSDLGQSSLLGKGSAWQSVEWSGSLWVVVV